jgi:hypothetical protein
MSENRRPTGVTLLVLFVLGVALWNGLRLLQTIVFWSILKEYLAKPGPLYAAISGGVWFLGGLSIAWGLWQGKNWACFAALGGVASYGSWYWVDRLVLQTPHANWLFSLAITILLEGCSAFLLLSPKTRVYFLRKRETSHD